MLTFVPYSPLFVSYRIDASNQTSDAEARSTIQEDNGDDSEQHVLVCSRTAVDVYVLLALIHVHYEEHEEAEICYDRAQRVLDVLGDVESLVAAKVLHNRGILHLSQVGGIMLVVSPVDVVDDAVVPLVNRFAINNHTLIVCSLLNETGQKRRG